MDRDQARTILWALGSPASEEQRRDGIGVVLDLLGETTVTAEPNPTMQAGCVGGARMLAERDQLQAENARLNKRATLFADDWHRIEKLVGREFTSPESVIDRIAWYVEQEQELTKTADELIDMRRERDELLAAARHVLAHTDTGQWMDLRALVALIDQAHHDEKDREDTH